MLPNERSVMHYRAHVVVGFAVARAVRRAVDRNRVRRLIREAYRRNREILLREAESFSTPLELVFSYSRKVSGSVRIPAYQDIEHDMKALLDIVVQTQRKSH